MAAASNSSHGCSWSWTDLAPELLGLVLLRLPSHTDRVRLRAVCGPWRCNAGLQPLPPPLPWIALPDGDFLTLPDGVIRRVPVPDDVSQRVSTGSMLFLVHRDDTCSLMNPFSSTAMTTPLAELAFCFPMEKHGHETAPTAPKFVKVVASDHLIAALTKSRHVAVSTRRPPQGASSCSAAMWAPPKGSVAVDIAVFQGKLYVLTIESEQDQKELHVLDLGNEGSIDDEQTTIMPGVKSVQCIRSTPRIAVDRNDGHVVERWFNPYSTEYYTHKLYLVASGDRLLLVKRKINLPPVLPFEEHKINRTRSFEVFEAAGLSGGHGRWSEVDTLRGHALFVSKGCCKSLPPVVAGQCDALGAREDSIYYINEETTRASLPSWKPTYQDPILDSGVYNVRDGTVMPFPLEVIVAPTREGPWRPTWLFPAES